MEIGKSYSEAQPVVCFHYAFFIYASDGNAPFPGNIFKKVESATVAGLTMKNVPKMCQKPALENLKIKT